MREPSAPGSAPMQAWGDGHIHSDWSDGFHNLEENVELFEPYDQDFHVAADHILIDVSRPRYSDAWKMPENRRRLFRLNWDGIVEYQAECRDSSSPHHLSIDGLELTWMNAAEGNFGTTDRAHVLVRENIQDLPRAEFFRGRSLKCILQELKDRGMRPFLAHINDAVPPDDLDGSEFSGIEIRSDIERREDPLRLEGLRHWDRWLSSGHHIALTSGSDAHQMDLWAASGARNVVTVGAMEREAVRDALLSGYGYTSATWHPDLYKMRGFEGINPAQSGGFTPWWRMAAGTQGTHDRGAARPRLEEMIAVTRDDDAGRAKRVNYPTLDFSIEEESAGCVADARDDARSHIRVSMTVPIRLIRIIAQGEVIWQEAVHGLGTQLERDIRLSLKGCRYARLEAYGDASDTQREYVLSSPIYLES